MSDNNDVPNVDEIKERLKIEVEDMPAEEKATQAEKGNVVDELQNLGRQVAETLKNAWASEERQKVETEVREGLKSFAGEIDKVLTEVRESQAAKKIKEEVSGVKEKVETSEIAGKARTGFVQGLKWLSVELGKLADQFTPVDGEAKQATEETKEE